MNSWKPKPPPEPRVDAWKLYGQSSYLDRRPRLRQHNWGLVTTVIVGALALLLAMTAVTSIYDSTHRECPAAQVHAK